MIRLAVKALALSCLVAAMAFACWATDPANTEAPATPAAAPTAADIAKLKAQLAEQQKQLDQLRALLDAQQKMLDQAATSASAAPAPAPSTPAAPYTRPIVGGLTASTTPMVQPDPSAAVRNPFPSSTPAPRIPLTLDSPSPQGAANPPAPLQLKIGETTIVPVGFMDMTAVFRTAATNFGIGTNFGSLPFNNGFPLSRLTELRLNPQNSRIGARVDTTVHGANVTAYWESDFLGSSGSNNLSVSSNSWVFRMRLYWVDVRKDKWEVMGGQSWSLLTPGRNGISPLPADIFYSQVMDTNYLVGMTWDRSPGFRFVYHPSDTVAAAIALEEADQYFGGSGGGGSPTLPVGLPSTFVNQLDTAANSTQTPNLFPDVIGKLAFDPKTKSGLHQHIEVVGLLREFRVYNQNNNHHFSAVTGGGSVNMNFEIAKGLHPILNTFWSDGGGRYLFGTVPDLAIRPDGSISPIHAYSSTGGFEYTLPKTLLFGYYGLAYGGRNVIIDLNGKPVGYGYTGSANTNNRAMQEVTGGAVQTLWRDPKWGALQLIFQYAWYNRAPWYVALGQPKNAHNSTVFLDLRYTLPGSAPSWH